MAKARTLKVFTAPIGFHDALVAAPSRAAALRAWGSEHDLFARGMASEVTDPALTAEPLAHPGAVIRRPRASLGEDGTASSTSAVTKAGRRRAAPAARKTIKPPKPSRRALDEAEVALATAKQRHKAEDAAAKAWIEDAQRNRRASLERAKAEEQRLETARRAEQERYARMLDRWRKVEGDAPA